MATEGPQLNDGAQTTAAVDLSGATTSYSGPNSSAQFLAVKITASRAVNIDSTGATVCYGILQNTPAS
ncbi:MAG: hypothetical protein KGL35_27035, partial [Bradyrhizobium sp.]|nr:hypothetical protein [Bradyrhizobium sp.]